MSSSNVGCYWDGYFAGAVCYTDDIVLLAPSASVLQRMLSFCECFAISHGLVFNAGKTQLIRFRTQSSVKQLPIILFNNTKLPYLDSVVHLDHVLTFSLDCKDDIIRVIKDMNCKANFIFCKFHVADPFIKCFLFKSYCLSLYGATLWSLSSPFIRLIEVALNKILWKVWNLSFKSHTEIVHCVAQIPTISNILYDRYCSFFSFLVLSPLLPVFVRSIFTDSSNYVYTFTGYNCVRL